MLGNIAKCFEWPLVRKALYKCSPFTIYFVVFQCPSALPDHAERDTGSSDTLLDYAL